MQANTAIVGVERLRLLLGVPQGAPSGPREQHPIVYKAEDFDNAVRRYSVNDQVPRLRHPILGGDEPAHGPEVKRSHSGEAGDLARTREGRIVANGRRCNEDQTVIPGRGGDAPEPGAVEQNGVDPPPGMTDQPVGH